MDEDIQADADPKLVPSSGDARVSEPPSDKATPSDAPAGPDADPLKISSDTDPTSIPSDAAAP